MKVNSFFKNDEPTVSLTVRVPYSYKEKLLEKANSLELTMSDLVWNMLYKAEGNPITELPPDETKKLQSEKTLLVAQLQNATNERNSFEEELQNLTNENYFLQKRISVLESEDNASGENEEAMEQIEELETEKTALEEQNTTLTEYIEMLQIAYCDVKRAYFISFAYATYLLDAEKDENGILEPEHQFYYKNKENIISTFEGIIEDKEEDLSDTDWENIQNVCELDIETNFEVILDKEKRELETTFDEKQAREQAQKQADEDLLKQAKFSSNDERILATLYLTAKRETLFAIPQVSKEKLKELKFDTGYWGRLSDKGGIYGNYELKRATINEDYEIIQLKPLVAPNATESITTNFVKNAPAQVVPATKQPTISKEEGILAKLYETAQKEGKIPYANKQELDVLGFETGFLSKLGARGAKYGEYELKKDFSDKVFEIIKLKKVA